jgi:Colicin V production protein
MQLTAQEYFFFIIVIMGVVGFIRGWRREIVSLAFLLAAILFLAVGGGTWITNLIFVRIPFAFGNSTQAPPTPSANTFTLTTIITFLVIVALGYLIGNRAFAKPGQPFERIMGIIPGIIAGVAIYTLIANTPIAALLRSINIRASSPDQGVVGSSLLLLFLIVVAVVIIGLISASAKKSAPKK